MKKLNIFLLLATIFTRNLISMEVAEDEKKMSMLNLPEEVILYMLDLEAREAINNWNDVFKKATNLDLSLIQDLSKTCTKFRSLCQYTLVSLNNFKNKKFEKLLENLKSESLEAHKNISKEELNNKLANLLNNISNSANSKEELKNAVKLILAGADVNIQNNTGFTALIWAAFEGHKEVLSILLNAGADINTKGSHGWTVLMCAASKGQKDIVKTLIDAGVDVNVKDNDGDTALMLAAGNGHKSTAEILINSGADVNSQDKAGNTALIWTAKYDHTGIVEILLNVGADVNNKDNNGNTALDLAVINNHKNIAEIIKNNINQKNI